MGECAIKNIYASMAYLKVKKKTIMQLALQTWMHEISTSNQKFNKMQSNQSIALKMYLQIYIMENYNKI